MNKEEIYQSIEHIAKCEMYDVIEVKYLKSKFEELQQENQKYKEVIDKSKNKLYEWGEALNPEFQKIMLDILKEVEDANITN